MNIKNTTYPENLMADIDKHTGVHLEVDYSSADVLKGIAAAIAMLSDQEQKMVMMRYRYHFTLDEIGAQFDLTGERVRQIIVRSMRKLVVKPKRYLMTEGLEGYINAEAKRIANIKIKIAAQQEYMRGYENGFALASGNAEANAEKTSDTDETILVVDMNLTVRSTNCLVRAKLETLEDLLKVDSVDTIYKVRNLGKKSAGEVAWKLNSLGFKGTVWDEFREFYQAHDVIIDSDVELTDEIFDEILDEE